MSEQDDFTDRMSHYAQDYLTLQRLSAEQWVHIRQLADLQAEVIEDRLKVLIEGSAPSEATSHPGASPSPATATSTQASLTLEEQYSQMQTKVDTLSKEIDVIDKRLQAAVMYERNRYEISAYNDQDTDWLSYSLAEMPEQTPTENTNSM